MIASWMAYTALVTGLLSLAGVALERAIHARGWPRRFAWITALGGSLAWPVVAAIRKLLPSSEPVMPFTITLPTQVITAGGSGLDRALLIDRTLIAVWVAASLFLLLRLARGVWGLRRTRDAWRRSEIDGMPVRLSPNVGPAVVGLRSMEVVLPEWIVSLDAPLRAIVLCHEDEHRRARDPYLLCAAAVAVALMPWNLALWIQARRLRLAIEMDCDARVLRSYPSAERYGLLMLTIAQRRSVAPALFAPMLSEPTSHLEKRIKEMRTTSRLTRMGVLGSLVVAVAVVGFACTLQSENSIAPHADAATNAAASKTPVYLEFQVTRVAAPAPGNRAPRYPDMLRAARVEGEVLAQFVVTADGSADMDTFKTLESTHDLFTATVRAALPQMRFTPAMVKDRAVKQLIQMPFTFSLSKDDGSVGSVRVPQPGPASGASIARSNRSGVSAEPRRLAEGEVYFEYQVERAVSPKPGKAFPRYPDAMREANIEGEVLAQFVVDVNGRADLSTFKVLKSTHEEFTTAVRSALPLAQYYPAEVGGKPVKQIVQMPFQFSLTK